jgi:putative transcriptional regulator
VGVGGKLLVALPVIVEDSFRRTVVLVLDHDDSSAFGVVINRPTELAVAAALPRWDERAAPPAVVFYGGPVQQDMAIALGREGDAVGPIDLDGDPALLTATDVRVFAGYAGWSAGEL